MPTTYSWAIAQLERSIPDNGVVAAHYRVVATDGEHGAETYSTCSFTPDPEAPDFTPYDELTEAQVVGWVKDKLGEEVVQASLDSIIDAKANPTSATGTPWQ